MAGGAWRWRVTAGRRAQAAVKAANAAGTVTAAQVLDGHVTLDLECLDRVYLNGYVPNLQVGGQVVTFLTQHLGNPIPSPALFNPIGERFRAAVTRFAAANGVPVVRFDKDQRKAEVMRPYLEAAQAAGRPGVVAVGVVSRPGFVGGYDALASGLIIVWSCPISQSFSYSAGGIFPQAEWSLSLLYQDTHSAVATVTSPASCHGPSRLISSFLYREFTASAAALS